MSRGASVRLVPLLFGLSGQAELPGPVLVQLLTDLGLSTSAARGLLARLRRRGQLGATRAGRQVRYRLDGHLAAGFDRLRSEQPPPTWSGGFFGLLYQVPEGQRAFRDRLRREAQLTGFGILTPGVLISLSDRFDVLAPVLEQAPAAARIYRARLEMAEPDAARAAAQAWDLQGLDRRYRAHLDRLRAAARTDGDRADAERLDGPEALRQLDRLFSPLVLDLLRAPVLPPVLLPDWWCAAEVRATLADAQRLYLPAAVGYVHRLLDGEPLV